MTKPRLAFFRLWDTHPIDRQVEAMLRRAFPEFEVVTFTAVPALRAQRRVMLRNAWEAVRLYGLGVLLGRYRWKDAFLHTPFLFQWGRAYAQACVAGGSYRFTFQLQSLLDFRVPGIPHFVYTDHTHLVNLTYPGFTPRHLAHAAWLALERELYCGATQVFVRSTHVLRSLVDQYGCDPRRVACVYAGGNVPLRPEPPDNANYTNGVILFVGTDWERKGGPDLWQAFRQVQARRPHARLVVVGCRPRLRHPQVEVVGRVPLARLPFYYRRASVYCLPTRREPFGVTTVEAMAYALPVVATRVGALPDLVQP